jgi:hypothetical protein
MPLGTHSVTIEYRYAWWWFMHGLFVRLITLCVRLGVVNWDQAMQCYLDLTVRGSRYRVSGQQKWSKLEAN